MTHGTVDFARPDFADLTIEDAATALARLYRWRGCVPVSVAMHSVIMARCARSKRAARWALVHDLHEIAIGDMPSPAKTLRGMLPFRAAEARFVEAVAVRFGLTSPMPEEVHVLDLRARRSEVEAYLPHALEVIEDVRPLPIAFTPAWSQARSRREFLREAEHLSLT